jgi:hypothetical protein
MAQTGQQITSTNQGPGVNIAIWIFVVCSGISVVFRIHNKIRKSAETINMRNLGWDDVCIMVALLLAIAQTVLISQQVGIAGLGKPWSSLTTTQIETFQKLALATQILYYSSIWMSKLSCQFFYSELARGTDQVLIVQVSILFVAMWGLSAVFGTAFQCQDAPKLWEVFSDQCMNQVVFSATIESFDGLIDVGLVLMAIYLLWGLQMDWKRKGTVLSAFTFRAL